MLSKDVVRFQLQHSYNVLIQTSCCSFFCFLYNVLQIIVCPFAIYFGHFVLSFLLRLWLLIIHLVCQNLSFQQQQYYECKLTLAAKNLNSHARMSMPVDRVEFDVSCNYWFVQVGVFNGESVRISFENLQIQKSKNQIWWPMIF